MGFDVSLGCGWLTLVCHALIGMGFAFNSESLFVGLAAYPVSFLMAPLDQAHQGELAAMPINVAVSLVLTTPLFTLGFSLILFRREFITWRQDAVAFMVLLGVVLIVARA